MAKTNNTINSRNATEPYTVHLEKGEYILTEEDVRNCADIKGFRYTGDAIQRATRDAFCNNLVEDTDLAIVETKVNEEDIVE